MKVSSRLIIGLGQVQTPIRDKNSFDEFIYTRYFSSMIKFFTYLVHKGKEEMTSDKCSRRITDVFEKEKPKIRYTIVQNKFKDWILPLLLPDGGIDRLILKKLM